RQKTYVIGSGSQLKYAVTNDIDKDDALDFIVANYGSSNIVIAFGDGRGNFPIEISMDTGSNSRPSAIAVDDFNGDTQLDIAVAYAGTHTTEIWLGNGNRSYQRQSTGAFTFNSSVIAMISGDLNNDRQSEIIIAYQKSDYVNILAAFRSPSFVRQDTPPLGFPVSSVDVGDFNNDSQLDIVVTNSRSSAVEVLLGYGNGSFSNQTKYLVGSRPYSVAVGDFNNDNQLDIVVANSNNSTVSILLGYGNGSFSNQTQYLVGSAPYSVAVGDFNNDNQLDIVVANRGTSDVSVLLGYGNGSFSNQTQYSVGSAPESVAVGDFNNDNQLDIVVANYINGS
ncbi:unnamed protein product, partial [Rotaria sp. Silwood2]